MFPAYRADGVNGQFTVDMRDLDGTPIVRDPSESTQTIGTETHQAVLAPTATAPWDSVPSTVLVGFRWDGGEGASEVRFGVEATGGLTTGTAKSQTESTTTQPALSTSAEPTTAVESADAEQTSGSSGAVFVLLGVAAVAFVAAAIVIRRRRSR
jgi:cobalamin biosynthesis Mg chelatase CobN